MEAESCLAARKSQPSRSKSYIYLSSFSWSTMARNYTPSNVIQCIIYLSTMDKTKSPNFIPPINIMRLEPHSTSIQGEIHLNLYWSQIGRCSEVSL